MSDLIRVAIIIIIGYFIISTPHAPPIVNQSPWIETGFESPIELIATGDSDRPFSLTGGDFTGILNTFYIADSINSKTQLSKTRAHSGQTSLYIESGSNSDPRNEWETQLPDTILRQYVSRWLYIPSTNTLSYRASVAIFSDAEQNSGYTAVPPCPMSNMLGIWNPGHWQWYEQTVLYDPWTLKEEQFSDSPIPLDRWFLLETWVERGNPGRFKVAVDGIIIFDVIKQTRLGSSVWDTRPFMLHDSAFKMYVDDVKIINNYLG